jgi:hypothetical protein
VCDKLDLALVIYFMAPFGQHHMREDSWLGMESKKPIGLVLLEYCKQQHIYGTSLHKIANSVQKGDGK